MQFGDRAHGPTSRNFVKYFRVDSESLSLANGKLVHRAKHKAMTDIVAGESPAGFRIVVIREAVVARESGELIASIRIVHELGERVIRLQLESARVALLDTHV